jgi:hypothetical protein
MIRFLKNIIVLFCVIIGTVTAVSVGSLGLYNLGIEIMKPRYEAAEVAAYVYVQGDPTCDMITPMIELMISRGYNIRTTRHSSAPENVRIPIMKFYDSDGDEIRKSFMSGLWSIGDIKLRFGESL